MTFYRLHYQIVRLMPVIRLVVKKDLQEMTLNSAYSLACIRASYSPQCKCMQMRTHHFWWWGAFLRWKRFRPVVLALDNVACPPVQKLCSRKGYHREPETIQNRIIVHVPYQLQEYFAGRLVRANREVR